MLRLTQLQLKGSRSRGFRAMSSLSFDAFGDPTKSLKAGDTLKMNEPTAGQVKVTVKTSQITAEDIRAIRGLSTHRTQTGVAGTYGVGTISSVGAGVVGVKSSDQVFIASCTGTWNSEAVLNSQQVFAIESIDDTQAACLSEAASAWALLHNFASLNAGDVVLRSAEPSTINSAIDQIGKAIGVVVVPASDSDLVDSKFKEKLAAKGAVKLGVTSGTGKAARALLSLTDKNGVLVTYNGGLPSMNDSLSGVEVPSLSLIFKNQSICGFDFHSWVRNNPTEASQAISESVKLIQNGKLKFSPVSFKVTKVADAVECANNGNCAVIEL